MSVFRPMFPKRAIIEEQKCEEDGLNVEGCIWTKRMIKELAETLDALEEKVNKLVKAFNEMVDGMENSDEAPELKEIKSDVKYIIQRMKRENQRPERVEKAEDEPVVEMPKKKGRKI